MALRPRGGGSIPGRGRRAGIVEGALIGLAVLAWGGRAWADDQQEFEFAKNRFDVGQYAEAHERFATLLDTSKEPCESGPSGNCRITEPDLIERARVLDAASLIALKRYAEADAMIEAVLRQDPTFKPNSTDLLPPEVTDRFTSIRGKIREELEKKAREDAEKAMKQRLQAQRARQEEQRWIAEITRMASEERRVTLRSRWIGLLPMGIGQYQNGDTKLGVFFTVSEALLGATTLVTAGIVSNYANVDPNQLDEQGNPIDREELSSRIATAATINRIAFTGWAALTLAGIVQAQIAFVPERVDVLKRPVPPRPKIMPAVSVLPGGAGVWVSGTF